MPFQIILNDGNAVSVNLRLLELEYKAYPVLVDGDSGLVVVGSLNLWYPSGETAPITSENYPYLGRTHSSNQLFIVNRGNRHSNNSVLKQLYYEALDTKNIRNSTISYPEITIFDLGKATNSLNDSNFRNNRWMVYRGKVPALEDVIKETFTEDFVRR